MDSSSLFDRFRARASSALDWYGPARALATAGSIVVVCIGAWWLLRAPAPPLENSLPFAGSVSDSASPPLVAGSPATFPTSSIGLGEITVHVVGAVVSPGVYTIASASRVTDAVEAAGGPAPEADLSMVNLALPLTDSDQVFIPSKGAQRSRTTTPASHVRRTNPTVATVPQAIAAASTVPVVATGGPSAGSGNGGVVNINTADAVALETLPGVGPATAKAILAHRAANGPFGRPEDLLEVKGIGDGKFAAMKPFIAVS